MNKKAARKAKAAREKKKKMIMTWAWVAAIVVLGIFLFVSMRSDSHEGRSVVDETVDIDFAAMSGTMVYAALLNMMRRANDHVGQSFRIRGTYHSFFWDVTGSYHHYVVVQDQTGCCPHHMEFRRSGDYTFPDDYPAQGVIIEMAGIFSTYELLGRVFFYLAVDEIIIVE